MRLTKKDHDVIRAFVEKRTDESKRLRSTGQELDGLWMGGPGIAYWRNGKTAVIVFRDLGSKAAQTVQRAIRRKAAPMDLLETYYKDPRKTRAGLVWDSKLGRWVSRG
jgi:hypothetical protein